MVKSVQLLDTAAQFELITIGLWEIWSLGPVQFAVNQELLWLRCGDRNLEEMGRLQLEAVTRGLVKRLQTEKTQCALQ
jgi:hypothetical protein